MRSLIGAGVVIVLTLTTGCTYVSQGDLEAKRACIDVDGDGAPQRAGDLVCEEDLEAAGLDTYEVDCDETSADRAPHLEEIPYDGIDNDCDDNETDVVDADDDGFPGILRADYEALGLMAWPGGLRDELDCDDLRADIHPGSSDEVPYDGLDFDCGADEDYDVDGDGFVPTLNPNSGLPHNPPYTGLLPTGDCDDNDPNANPGVVAFDAPYDGVDLNCDCANDYDADGDDFMSDIKLDANGDPVLVNDEVVPIDPQDFDDFKGRYGCVYDGVGGNPPTPTWGDCDDDASAVFPGATDVWYDGTDSDCAADDDYDQDLDGYVDDVYEDESELPIGDCDDTDDMINPVALELLGDAVDQDCNGGPDTANFAFAEADWVNPIGPRVGWTGEHYVLAIGAEQWTDQSSTTPITQDWPGLLFRFEPDADGDGATDVDNSSPLEDNHQTWNGLGQADPLGGVIDLVTDPSAGRVFIGVSLTRSMLSGDFSYLGLRGFEWGTVGYSTLPTMQQSVDGSQLANDIDLQIADTGSVFVASCGDSHLQFIQAGWSVGTFSRESDGKTSLVGGSACVLTLDPAVDEDAVLMVQPDAGIWRHPKPYLLQNNVGSEFVDLDPFNVVVDPFHGQDLDLVNRDGDLTSVYDLQTGNTTVTGPGVNETVFSNVAVRDISAARAPSGELFVLAVTEDRGTDGLDDLVMLHGTPGDTLTEVELSVDDGRGTLQAHGASILVDADRVFLAVAMRDTNTGAPVDDIGWMFLGFAP